MGYLNLYNKMPYSIKKHVSGYSYEEKTFGMSGAFTYQLNKNNTTIYIKAMPVNAGISLSREAAVIKWLQGRLPIAELIDFTVTQDMEYMLLSEIAGLYACHPSFKNDVKTVVKALAEGMRLMHSMRIDDCPLLYDVDMKLKESEIAVAENRIDINNFEEKWKDYSPLKIFEIMQNTKPAYEDLVFTHGDYCLPNIIIKNGSFSGFIDLGRAGVADRYQDIALCLRSLRHNWGEGYDGMLLSEYGLSSPDWDKIEYYTMLDELF